MSTFQRNDSGEYIINGKPHISVTTVQGYVQGTYESLFKNYHCKLCRSYNENVVNQFPHDVQELTWDQLNLGLVHAQEDRKAKGDYGTMAHGVLEQVFFHEWKEPPVGFINRVVQIRQIYLDLGLELLHSETTLYSDKLLSAGTSDFIAISRKFVVPRLYIGDYKSGSANKKKEVVQLGGYGEFILEMIKNKQIFIQGLPEKFTLHGLVLHIGRSDEEKVKPTFVSPQQMKIGATAYKHLLKYYRYMKSKL